MKANNVAMPLSEALEKAKLKGWPFTPIREAVVNEEIPSRRSSNRPKARYYVDWRNIEEYMAKLGWA